MSEVNEYAGCLLKRNLPKLPAGVARQPSGRKKRTGSVLAGKRQTVWEATKTATVSIFYTKLWANLFSPERNKWTKDGLPLTPTPTK